MQIIKTHAINDYIKDLIVHYFNTKKSFTLLA